MALPPPSSGNPISRSGIPAPRAPAPVPVKPGTPTLQVLAKPAAPSAAELALINANKIAVITAALPPGTAAPQIAADQLDAKLLEALDLLTLRDQTNRELSAAEKLSVVQDLNQWKTSELRDELVSALSRHHAKRLKV